MRTFAIVLAALLLSGCITARSQSQAAHTYRSANSVDDVRSCVTRIFNPRFNGGVPVQGGWPPAPYDMRIEPFGTGAQITTIGPMDRRFGACI